MTSFALRASLLAGGAQRAVPQRHGRPHRLLVAGDERTDPDPASGHYHDRANACEYHRRKTASGSRWNVLRFGLPWRAEMYALMSRSEVAGL